MAVTHNRYKFVTVSLPKRLHNGRLTSETATWIQKWFKISAGTSRKLFKAGTMGVVIEIFVK
jgi:hypothetical protein